MEKKYQQRLPNQSINHRITWECADFAAKTGCADFETYRRKCLKCVPKIDYTHDTHWIIFLSTFHTVDCIGELSKCRWRCGFHGCPRGPGTGCSPLGYPAEGIGILMSCFFLVKNWYLEDFKIELWIWFFAIAFMPTCFVLDSIMKSRKSRVLICFFSTRKVNIVYFCSFYWVSNARNFNFNWHFFVDVPPGTDGGFFADTRTCHSSEILLRSSGFTRGRLSRFTIAFRRQQTFPH